jgi:hypothetical protein
MANDTFKGQMEYMFMFRRSGGSYMKVRLEHISSKRGQIANRVMCRLDLNLHESTFIGQWMTGNE